MALLDKCGVYLITCKLNCKVYVGSSLNIRRRAKDHFNSLKRGGHFNKHMQMAYDKYGKKCFSIVPIEYCNCKDEMLKREEYWIHELESYKKEKGYNKATNVFNSSGFKMPEETIRWRSNHEKEKWKKLHPNERKRRIKILTDASRNRKNKKHKRETKIKNSRKMMFVRIRDNKSFIPELPSEFMKENNLDRSACHKVAKGTAYKLKDQRHGGEYKTVLSQHKGFMVYYL